MTTETTKTKLTITETKQDNCLNVDIPMLPKQRELLFDRTKYILMQGGSGSGKTMGGAIKALKTILEYPGIHGMVTAPSYNMLADATIPTYQLVFTKDFIKSFNSTKNLMFLNNGSDIHFRTTNDPYLLRGGTYGFVHMDEPADSPALAFKIAQARLRQHGMPCQAWLTGTPKGYNWLYHEFVARDRPNYKRIQARTDENFLAPEGYYESMKESFTDKQFALQELEGQFVELGARCPFATDAIHDMYEEARDGPIPEPRNGWIHTYRPFSVGKRYVMGVDVATGVGEDWSTFVLGMVSPSRINIVSCGKVKMPETEFAYNIHNISKDYDNALIVPERAPVGTSAIQTLEELGAKLYFVAAKAGVVVQRTGKAVLVADLADAIRDSMFEIPHMEILEQLLSYGMTEKGKYEGAGGSPDDYVSALMMLVQGTKYVSEPMGIKIYNTCRRE